MKADKGNNKILRVTEMDLKKILDCLFYPHEGKIPRPGWDSPSSTITVLFFTIGVFYWKVPIKN